MIIDPRKIKSSDLPLIVLADNTRSFMGLLIKLHSRGNYSHIMTFHKEGYFASQGWMFKEVPIEKYMKGNYRLKFWKCKDLTEEERIEWLALTKKELNAPWWQRRYDFLGIIGSLFFLRFINNPWTKFCSERVANKIRILGLYVKKHRTPSEINFLLRISGRFEVLGHHLPS